MLGRKLKQSAGNLKRRDERNTRAGEERDYSIKMPVGGGLGEAPSCKIRR